jgi:site-specific recombinase XerD
MCDGYTVPTLVVQPLVSASAHLSVRQYARLVKHWVALMGADPAEYGTHSLRRTKATLIYRKTKNLRAVQLLLGHRKIESTVRYLCIDVDDAIDQSGRNNRPAATGFDGKYR